MIFICLHTLIHRELTENSFDDQSIILNCFSEQQKLSFCLSLLFYSIVNRLLLKFGLLSVQT